MAAAKKQTKKDLEIKIAELEAKLNKLSTQLSTKPAETKPAETAKPKQTLPKGMEAKPEEAPKPAETKPAETAKPKQTLPKGMEAKPEDAPKPAETTAEPPATVQAALENAYMNAPMTDLHHYRAKTTGYTPAPNRYFVRLTAPTGTVPTTDWNQQKATVTGYTQPSNQYFATRARLAYHPADKTFGGYSGINMNVQGVVEQAPTPEASAPEPTVSETTNDTSGKSKQDKLADYEADYLKRLEQDKIDAAKAEEEALIAEAKAAAAKAAANQKGGALPKGFEKVPEPEAPKKSRGTLPKGF
jgi:hypothetical protein